MYELGNMQVLCLEFSVRDFSKGIFSDFRGNSLSSFAELLNLTATSVMYWAWLKFSTTSCCFGDNIFLFFWLSVSSNWPRQMWSHQVIDGRKNYVNLFSYHDLSQSFLFMIGVWVTMMHGYATISGTRCTLYNPFMQLQTWNKYPIHRSKQLWES